MPGFMTFDVDSYIIKPTQISQIGSFKVSGYITDTQLSSPFSFIMTILNDPPYFQEALTDQTIILNSIVTYNLPSSTDLEKLPFTITVSL